MTNGWSPSNDEDVNVSYLPHPEACGFKDALTGSGFEELHSFLLPLELHRTRRASAQLGHETQLHARVLVASSSISTSVWPQGPPQRQALLSLAQATLYLQFGALPPGAGPNPTTDWDSMGDW